MLFIIKHKKDPLHCCGRVTVTLRGQMIGQRVASQAQELGASDSHLVKCVVAHLPQPTASDLDVAKAFDTAIVVGRDDSCGRSGR